MAYNPANWYWIVAGDSAHVWSSGRALSVGGADADYETWLAAGNAPTRIASYAELYDVLAQRGLSNWDANSAALLATNGLTPQQGLTYALAKGLAITSTATPALDGTYAVDDAAQRNLIALYTSVKGSDGLPGGGTTFFYRDITGAPHSFAAGDITALAKAVRDYVYALGIAAAEPTPVWPPATAAIP